MDKKHFLCMFCRPYEPIFYPKGAPDNQVIFDIPADFLACELQNKATKLLNKFNNLECERLDLCPYVDSDFYKLNLDEVLTVKRDETFSDFNPKHQAAANRLIEILLGCKKFEKLMIHAAYVHDRVNVELYVYALAFVLVHREDLEGLFVPPQWQTVPHQFFDTKILKTVQTRALMFDEPSDREPVEIPFDLTGNDGDLEHRVAYWREDIGVNLHHWHWHLVYPVSGPINIINKDRRGELFFYMHHQIMARYNTERLCNNLNLAMRYMDWRRPIQQAYFPKLTAPLASQTWGSRPAGLALQDVDRADVGLYIDVADLERWRDRVYSAVHSKTVRNARGQTLELDALTGIDTLGNLVESNILSVDGAFYGSLHGAGHLLIAFVHDPSGTQQEPMGVMAANSTAMRDPIFYGWHGYLDDLFLQLKDSFAPYTNAELVFDGIEVTKVGLCIANENGTCQETSNLSTFWQKTDVDLSRGLDFAPSGSIYARITHLNHDEFLYNIEIQNNSNSVKNGTVRIFMAPVNNSDGSRFRFRDQKDLMIEMDKFMTTLQPGKNAIARKSTESTLTISFEQTFRDLNDGRPRPSNPEALDRFNFCGCGWPQHMLVSKGNGLGFPMELFVMVSDYEEDKIEQADPTGCKTGFIFCGLKNLKYPDKRAMGYPFDRAPAAGINVLSDFLKPNMKTLPFTITHSNTVKQPNIFGNTNDSINLVN